MIILGIDPGTAIVGFGVIDFAPSRGKDALRYVNCGVIRTDAGLPDAERLKIISDDLVELIATYRPDKVGVEDLFFSNNQKTVITVAQARGVILLEFQKAGVPIISMTPLQVKQSVTAFGKADKQQVGEMVVRILNLSAMPTPDDAADALAVAIAASAL